MEYDNKCRICLKYRKNLRFLKDSEDGITYADMLTSIAKVKIQKDLEEVESVCLSCRKKLREAYNFKIEIERSDVALNEHYKRKIIHFNNIKDISIEIDIDYKPTVKIKHEIEEMLKAKKDIAYSDTTIKIIKNNKHDSKKLLTVAEFLNSIKTEDDFDSDYHDCEVDVNDGSDCGSEYSVELKKIKKKKTRHKTKKENKSVMNMDELDESFIPLLEKPIKPIYITDVGVIRNESFNRKEKNPEQKKKYKRYKKKSICPYCGKIFTALDVHILTHNGERTFKCEICSKGFFTKKRLEMHSRTHSEKQFKCNQCVAAFTNRVSLNSHMAVHKDDKNFICDVCNKAFKRRNSLRRHILLHNLGNKHIHCELCSMTFYTKAHLLHHMRVHTGERPYKCEICSQPYSYKHDFNRHCLNKHGVFLKRRSVNIMNEEILQRERALMKELMLRAHGVLRRDEVPELFDGPQAALAFEQAMKVIESKQLPISL